MILHPTQRIKFAATVIAILVSLLFCRQSGVAQDILFIKPADLARWQNHPSDTVFVLNFWATWCAPCVAELPVFEKLTAEYHNQAVKVVLVSADFKRSVETALKPFVRKQQLKSRVVFMDEPDANLWVNQISKDWSGAIPATLVISKPRGFEWFHEGQLTYKKLNKSVKKALKRQKTK